MTFELRIIPDPRTPDCQHDQTQGCYRCCHYCDVNEHCCGGCGDPLEHQSHTALGTCPDCYKLYFTDPEETP